MKTLLTNFLLPVSLPETQPLSEEEFLLLEIEKAKDMIDYAWNRFDYAAQEYVELAVLELLLTETHYSLLIRRYRLMLGIHKSPYSSHGRLQNHAFYGSLLSTAMGD